MTIFWVFSKNHQVFFVGGFYFHKVYGIHNLFIKYTPVKGIYIGSMYVVQILFQRHI